MSSTMFPWFIPTFFVRFDFSVFYREFSSTFFFAFFLAFPALCGRWEEASVSSAALATNCWHRRACNSTIEWPWRWRWWWSKRFRTLPPEELHRSILSSWPRHANEAATLSAIGPHTPYPHAPQISGRNRNRNRQQSEPLSGNVTGWANGLCFEVGGFFGGDYTENYAR